MVSDEIHGNGFAAAAGNFTRGFQNCVQKASPGGVKRNISTCAIYRCPVIGSKADGMSESRRNSWRILETQNRGRDAKKME